jgi:L-iditol 2-dehydrogenase/galactitol-1-phosphate 5-dehydrogenase
MNNSQQICLYLLENGEYACYAPGMEALVLVHDRTLEVQQVPLPPAPGPEWALVCVAWSGICNSDLHRGFGGGAYRYPLIMGHEFSGIVERPAAGGRHAAGERVVAYPLIPCRRCAPCRAGEYAQCLDYDYLGSRRDGAFTERVWVPDANLLAVPAQVGLREAALTEPCAVALHGASKLDLRPEHTAAVFGGGPIGNMVAQWLRARGCRRVLVVDLDPVKLALAASMGFTPIDAREQDPVEAIRRSTGGDGADRVVEAVGLPATFLQAIQSAARFAEVVFLGNIRGSFTIGQQDFSGILRRELKIFGTWNSKLAPEGTSEWDTVLAGLDRDLEVEPLITHTPALREGPEIFLRIVERRLGSFGKVVFKLSGER